MSCTLKATVSPGLGVTQEPGSREIGRELADGKDGKVRGAFRALITSPSPSLSLVNSGFPRRAPILPSRPDPRGAGSGSLLVVHAAAADGTPADPATATADPEPTPMPAGAASSEAPAPDPIPAPAPASAPKGGAPKAAGGGGLKEVVLHPGFTLGAHLASAGLVALTFFNGSLFGYHPTLMAASFLLFMPEALLSAIRGGVGKGRKTAVVRHALLNSGAMVAALWGLAAIWINKNRIGKPHLQSLHALVGIAAFGASFLVATGGAPLLLGFPPALKKMGLPKIVYDGHKQFGFVAYLIGVAATILGLQTFKPAHPLHKGAITYALAGLSVLSAALVWGSVLVKKGGKAKAKAKSS